MPFAPSQRIRRSFKPRLDRNHIPAGEAIFSAPILAERDKLGRCLDPSQGLVELLLVVRMAMHKHSKVAAGECRLLTGDRVQCDFGFGDDLFAIGASDGVVFDQPLGVYAMFRHA